MTRTEVLKEHETRAVEMDPDTASTLARLAGTRLQVAATSTRNVFQLRSMHWVGTIITDELEILIRPKIGLDNLLLLLDTGMPSKAWEPETFAFAARPRLLAAVASFFARTVEQTLGRGIRRDYRAVDERLHAVRGRIRFQELARRPGLPLPLPVTYQDYTVDILENRGIKAALGRLLQVTGIEPGTRGLFIRELSRLEGVTDAHVDPEELDRLPFTRLNRYYEPALRLAVIILRNLTLVDQPGRATAGAFLLDMNRLFQDYMTRQLRDRLRGRLHVVSEPRRWLDRRRRVTMWPDLEFRRGGEPVLVGDLKYKLLAGELARNADYYQLHSYVASAGLTDGLLIYCFVDGTPPPRIVEVQNSDVHLHLTAVDLSGGSADIRRGVEGIGDVAETLTARPFVRTRSGTTAPAPL